MSPRRQFGLSITFVDDDDDDAVMRVPGIVEKEPSPSVAVVTPPSDERWAGFSAAEKEQSIIVEADALLPKELLVRVGTNPNFSCRLVKSSLRHQTWLVIRSEVELPCDKTNLIYALPGGECRARGQDQSLMEQVCMSAGRTVVQDSSGLEASQRRPWICKK